MGTSVSSPASAPPNQHLPDRPVLGPDVSVLVLLENEPYPYDGRVRRHAAALVEAGCRVTVASPAMRGFDRREEMLDGVRVMRYPAPPGGRGALTYLREYAHALVWLRRLARRADGERRVDVVIACSPPDFLHVAARPLLRRGAGMIFDHHDLSPELYERKFGRRGLPSRALVALERRAFATADVVISSNDSYAAVAGSRGRVGSDRLFVVRSAPEPGRIFPVEPQPVLRRGRAGLVLWTGNITQPDRVLPLLEAADELVNRRGRDDIAFTLAGPGDGRDAVMEEVRRRGLSSAIDLPGQIDDEAMRAYLATADVCVSVDERNPMNDRSTVTKVLDYMAAGRPVVQFPLEEMRRVCGDACVYAKEGDPSDLATRIAELLDDPERRAELGRRARERMLDGRMWPDEAPALIAAVRQALAVRR